jgi:hypothetical protein
MTDEQAPVDKASMNASLIYFNDQVGAPAAREGWLARTN